MIAWISAVMTETFHTGDPRRGGLVIRCLSVFSKLKFAVHIIYWLFNIPYIINAYIISCLQSFLFYFAILCFRLAFINKWLILKCSNFKRQCSNMILFTILSIIFPTSHIVNSHWPYHCLPIMNPFNCLVTYQLRLFSTCI